MIKSRYDPIIKETPEEVDTYLRKWCTRNRVPYIFIIESSIDYFIDDIISDQLMRYLFIEFRHVELELWIGDLIYE
jgi:hypothetical protein